MTVSTIDNKMKNEKSIKYKIVFCTIITFEISKDVIIKRRVVAIDSKLRFPTEC